MLLPRPKKEMFTSRCTLFTKLVPAVGPRLFFLDDVEAENSTMVESHPKQEVKVTGWAKRTSSASRPAGPAVPGGGGVGTVAFSIFLKLDLFPEFRGENRLRHHLSGEIKPYFHGNDNKLIHLVWSREKKGKVVFRIVT